MRHDKKVEYHHIRVGEGDTCIFRHTFQRRGKQWHAQAYAPLVGRYADHEAAVAETERLNREVAPNETERLNTAIKPEKVPAPIVPAVPIPMTDLEQLSLFGEAI